MGRPVDRDAPDGPPPRFVKFLVDAQLPRRLARFLTEQGHEALHVSELDTSYQTPDSEIAHRADIDGRVVVTKDRDFRDTHLLTGVPRRLMLVVTGNISNADLLRLIQTHLADIVNTLDDVRFLEITEDTLIAHKNR